MQQNELSESVRRSLASAGIAGRVTVEETTAPGVIRLLGQVISEMEKLRVDQIARSVDGVLEVIDEIILGRPK